MRILLDYRPALRARTGVGEYMHHLAQRLARDYPDDAVTLFSSSWKDRLPIVPPGFEGTSVGVADRRIPVSLLNLTWHNLAWPTVDTLTGQSYDVVYSPHPLLTPTRRAAQVVTIHDLTFLDRPGEAVREVARDYPRLAARHARRADAVIVSSRQAAADVAVRFGVEGSRIHVCPPGAPPWQEPPTGVQLDGHVLFVGAFGPRKNLSTALSAFARLCERRPSVPRLKLVGDLEAGPAAELARIGSPPLGGHVDVVGYVDEADRERLYRGARVLVLPSYDEGFGLPALEAMSLGVPVIASDRGSLPEVLRDAGLLAPPDDVEAWAAALERVLTDDAVASRLSHQGLERARDFDWKATARTVHQAFEDAVEARAHRH